MISIVGGIVKNEIIFPRNVGAQRKMRHHLISIERQINKKLEIMNEWVYNFLTRGV